MSQVHAAHDRGIAPTPPLHPPYRIHQTAKGWDLVLGGKCVGTYSQRSAAEESLIARVVPQLKVGLTMFVDRWPSPPLGYAYHGIPGEFVRLIEPHSEADPVGLLTQFLVYTGNIAGRHAHYVAEADEHYPNLYTVLVGKTSKGRKGSSKGRTRAVAEQVDSSWAADGEICGLSSGEGLIHAVRDPVYRSGKGEDGDEQQLIDAGVRDKRRLVFEAEFALVLRVMQREGNVLSAILRSAWDCGNLQNLTKNSPAKATGAHISIVAHTTRDETSRYLTRTETANGFANRFIWIAVRRSKRLPFGGTLSESAVSALAKRLRKAIRLAENAGRLDMDPAARVLWEEMYDVLSEGKPGLHGAVTGRAEAQVVRLAVLYAVLDQSHEIRLEHLLAALDLWGYAERSAAWIFGESLGDPDADEILRALRAAPEGLTRTEIRDLFKRNRPVERVNRALGVLLQHELAHYRKDPGRGRPSERWFATTTETTNTTEGASNGSCSDDRSFRSYRSSAEDCGKEAS